MFLMNFSPEEFTDSDIDFVIELSERVKEVWKPKYKGDFILNLPATVERKPPKLLCRHDRILLFQL